VTREERGGPEKLFLNGNATGARWVDVRRRSNSSGHGIL
jgi:hypothetical protein